MMVERLVVEPQRNEECIGGGCLLAKALEELNLNGTVMEARKVFRMNLLVESEGRAFSDPVELANIPNSVYDCMMGENGKRCGRVRVFSLPFA